jgi:hypothetical protein
MMLLLLETLRTQVLLEPVIGTPGLGAVVRPGVLGVEHLGELISGSGSPQADHLRSLVLLWHDHLDASHQVSQGLEDATGAYLHGMMHRREGDFGNAKYWFHRAGPQLALVKLAQRLGAHEPDRFLLERGCWNADAFVDCCASASASASPASRERYRALQGEEFLALADAFLRPQQ